MVTSYTGEFGGNNKQQIKGSKWYKMVLAPGTGPLSAGVEKSQIPRLLFLWIAAKMFPNKSPIPEPWGWLPTFLIPNWKANSKTPPT